MLLLAHKTILRELSSYTTFIATFLSHQSSLLLSKQPLSHLWPDAIQKVVVVYFHTSGCPEPDQTACEPQSEPPADFLPDGKAP